ncbi:MAG: DUF4411 family protein [Planctomycetota bacterium]
MPIEPPTRYNFDANAWVGFAWREFPRDVFVSLWQRIEDGIDEGRIFTVDFVFMEIQRQDDELSKWMKEKRESTPEFVIASDAEIQIAGADLINTYALKQDADPFVVAAAKKYGLTVVTNEKRRDYPREKPPKMPNLCQFLNVPCITPLAMIKAEGWKF